MDMVEPFVALVIYPTTPDAQSRQADNLARIASEKIRELPGFLRAPRLRVGGRGEPRDPHRVERPGVVPAVPAERVRPGRDPPRGRSCTPRAYWLRQHATVEAP